MFSYCCCCVVFDVVVVVIGGGGGFGFDEKVFGVALVVAPTVLVDDGGGEGVFVDNSVPASDVCIVIGAVVIAILDAGLNVVAAVIVVVALSGVDVVVVVVGDGGMDFNASVGMALGNDGGFDCFVVAVVPTVVGIVVAVVIGVADIAVDVAVHATVVIIVAVNDGDNINAVGGGGVGRL
jgi:hypothetical protein